MSDKKLLEEQTIRRFMKLAKIEGLADGFVENNSGVIKEGKMERREVSMATEKRGEYSKGAMQEMESEEEGHMPSMEEEEELMGKGEHEEHGGGDMETLVHDMISALAGAAKKHGVEVDVEGGEGGEHEMGGEEDLGDLEMGGHEEHGEEHEEEKEEGGEESEEEEQEEEEEGKEMDEAHHHEEDEEEEEEEEESQEESIAEAVLNRVKARLIAEARAAKEKEMKGKKGMSKIKAKKGAKMEEKHGKGGSGLASQGGNKFKKGTGYMEETAGHSQGKASSKNWGVSGKGVGNTAKSSAKKGNMTPAKKSSKHTK